MKRKKWGNEGCPNISEYFFRIKKKKNTYFKVLINHKINLLEKFHSLDKKFHIVTSNRYYNLLDIFVHWYDTL